MIDGGSPNKAEAFKQAIEKIQMNPQDIKLMVLTHGHFDHIGSAKEIKEITGAKIAMHLSDIDYIDKSKWTHMLPKGVGIWGSINSALTHVAIPFINFPPFEVDIVIRDEGMPLTGFGIPGKVVYTPGHTAGSISVILDSGDAFIGCLAQNKTTIATESRTACFG